MSLPARLSVWSAVEAAGHGRVRDLLHADCDVHSVAPCVCVPRSGRADEPVTPPDDLILAAIGPPGRNVGTVEPLTRSVLDVLVVGAGPAGVAAAIEARRLGLDALVVDKAAFPRDKTCGDGLTTGALRLLDALGLRRAHAARRRWRSPTPCWCRPPAARSRSPLPPDGAYAGVVPRVELDAALVDHARGARRRRARGRRRHRVRDDGDAVTATLADGTERHRALGRSPPTATTPPCAGCSRARERELGTWQAFRQYFSGVDDRRLWVLFEEDFLPGYAWMFPVGDGRANLGFGVLRDGTTARRAARRSPRSGASLADRPSVRRALGPNARPEGTVRAWPIPADYDRSRLTHGRALFVGDAANVVDPMTGEGIAQALETGALAARADRRVTATTPTPSPTRYRADVDRALGADLRFAALLQHILRVPLGARAAIAVAAAHPVDPPQLRPLDVRGLPPRAAC